MPAPSHAPRAPIRDLDPALAARVAAGEIIERPASVVKELLENAIDAGATRVMIELMDGGQTLIRVTDNGCGISPDQVAVAFRRHATSKISTLDDLFAIPSLGFRGEALPSIAAVAETELATRSTDEAHGAVVRASAAEIGTPVACGLPPGTTVTVRDLFARLPARLKFLKSRIGEVAAVQAVVAHYALAYPALHLVLQSDGRNIFTAPGTGSLADTICTLYGADVARNLLEVEIKRHDTHAWGFVSRPDLSRPSRTHQSFLVNGRWVRNAMLSAALQDAYRTHLMTGRYPVAVVHITLPPEQVDVNVHPTKSEIKFLLERDIFALVRDAARAAVDTTMSDPGRIIGGESLSQQPLDMADPADSAGPRSGAVEPVATPRANRMPTLRVLGQANNLYIIAEGPDGVYMIDQHAAHERVLFDNLVDGDTSAQSQHLLEPVVADLNEAQWETLEASAAAVAEIGFAVEPFGSAACLIRAVPGVLAHTEPAAALCALLDTRVQSDDPRAWREHSLATVACKSAVKAGQCLTLEEMRELVYRLEQTTRPRTCPHGRPTMILLTSSLLEREFGRRGA